MAHREFGQVFTNIGVYETQKSASVAFSNFGIAHATMADEGMKFIKNIGPMLRDLYTFLEKAVPDTKLTLKKYSDAKFEFLAYCLKVKEMDDEEYEAASFGQPLNRVLLGNFEYRMFLRCRHAAKVRFIKLRSDVLVKLQLLDNKRVQDVAFQLERLIAGMYIYYRQSYRSLKPAAVFPIEVELGIDLGIDAAKHSHHSEGPTGSSQDDPSSCSNSNGVQTAASQPPPEGQSAASQLPPVDDLLLDLGGPADDLDVSQPLPPPGLPPALQADSLQQ